MYLVAVLWSVKYEASVALNLMMSGSNPTRHCFRSVISLSKSSPILSRSDRDSLFALRSGSLNRISDLALGLRRKRRNYVSSSGHSAARKQGKSLYPHFSDRDIAVAFVWQHWIGQFISIFQTHLLSS